MKTLEITMQCMATYKTHIDVPKDMSLEDAVAYANDNTDKLAIESPLTYVGDSDGTISEEDCRFM